MVSNAIYLICIFMNCSENIKNGLKSINKQFSGPNHHYDTVIAQVIDHVDKYIDVMDLFENFISFAYS